MEYQVNLGFTDGTVRTIRSHDVDTLTFIWHTFNDLSDRWDGPVLSHGVWEVKTDGSVDWAPLDLTNIL